MVDVPESQESVAKTSTIEDLNEIALDIEDIIGEALPDSIGLMIDQGLLFDRIAKLCERRLEAIKGSLPKFAGAEFTRLQSQALSTGVGGTLAMNGFQGMVTLRVGKAATRLNSDKIRLDVPESELVQRGWLKLDSKPSTAISFSRKIAA